MVSEMLLEYVESWCNLYTMLFHRIMLHEEKDMSVRTIRFLSASHASNKKFVLTLIPLDAGLLLLVANKPRSEISIIGTV